MLWWKPNSLCITQPGHASASQNRWDNIMEYILLDTPFTESMQLLLRLPLWSMCETLETGWARMSMKDGKTLVQRLTYKHINIGAKWNQHITFYNFTKKTLCLRQKQSRGVTPSICLVYPRHVCTSLCSFNGCGLLIWAAPLSLMSKH